MYFAAGVYLSEAPDPIPPPPSVIHCINIEHIPYLFTHEGGGGVDEPVRGLEGR